MFYIMNTATRFCIHHTQNAIERCHINFLEETYQPVMLNTFVLFYIFIIDTNRVCRSCNIKN